MIDSFITITCCMLWQFTKHYFNQSYASFRANSISLMNKTKSSRRLRQIESSWATVPLIWSPNWSAWSTKKDFIGISLILALIIISLYIIIEYFKQDSNHINLIQSLTYYTAHNPPLLLKKPYFKPIKRSFILWHIDPFLGNDREVFSMWSVSCPFLGNGSLNTFPQKQTRGTIGHLLLGKDEVNWLCFPGGPCKVVIRESSSEAGSSVECSAAEW
jgi:hypothetical protein